MALQKFKSFNSGSSEKRFNTSKPSNLKEDTYECRNASKSLWTFVPKY